jgi:hypothetical protein
MPSKDFDGSPFFRLLACCLKYLKDINLGIDEMHRDATF